MGTGLASARGSGSGSGRGSRCGGTRHMRMMRAASWFVEAVGTPKVLFISRERELSEGHRVSAIVGFSLPRTEMSTPR